MNEKIVGFKFSQELYNDLKLRARTSGLSMTTVVKLALQAYMKTPVRIRPENPLLKKLRKDPEVCRWVVETYSKMPPETRTTLAHTEAYDALLKELQP